MRKGILGLALLFVIPVLAQNGKKLIGKAADLPVFQYKLDGKAEDLLQPGPAWDKFRTQFRQDHERILAGYEIADKSLARQIEFALTFLEIAEGKLDAAEARIRRVRELEEKPGAKLASTVWISALVSALRATPDVNDPSARRAAFQYLNDALKPMPYAVVANDIKETKAGMETLSRDVYVGLARASYDPVVAKTGALSSDLGRNVPVFHVFVTKVMPLRDSMVEALSGYLAANKVEKPDIWQARDVALPAGKYTPVVVAVWDSGVDTTLFRSQTVQNAVLAYDVYNKPATGSLRPLTAEEKRRYPDGQARLKGFSDMQANIDSPEAAAIKKELAGLKPDAFKAFVEELNLYSNYAHGTHVAGILLAGNPYARLVVGRLTFQHTIQPDPCPTEALVDAGAKSIEEYVKFFKKNKVRVVNMSWGSGIKGYETQLEQCAIGADTAERKSIARRYFEREKVALETAISSAPEILFIAAAGNSDSDATFDESIPSALRLPNLLTVGAVDKAGDEAPFTSYGPTVVVHANGYQVESTVPGGKRIPFSGTSMASPNVANLAAKLIAVNPKLNPVEVIQKIRDTAEKTADGRRNLIDPKKALGI